MANSLFDQRVVNAFERPVSEDPNLGLSQDSSTLRTMMGYIYELSESIGSQDGFIGDGFKPVPYNFVPAVPMALTIKRGLGFRAISSANQLAIGGISGVNDVGNVKPLFLRNDLAIDVPAAPAVGQARRDIIAVRWAPHLSDSRPSRIFATQSRAFTLQSKFKTLTWDLSDYLPTYLTAGGSDSSSLTDPIIYAPGLISAYNAEDPDSITTCPLPTVPSDYAIVAVVNVVGGATAITETDIVDYRRRAFPGSLATLYAKPTIGALEVLGEWLAGQDLANAGVLTANSLTAFISRSQTPFPPLPSLCHNEYTITVIGARSARALTLSATPIVSSGQQYRPIGVVIVNRVIDGRATHADCVEWASSRTPEGGEFAIGQPYSAITFRAGVSELTTGVINALNTNNIAWNVAGTAVRTIDMQLQATLIS